LEGRNAFIPDSLPTWRQISRICIEFKPDSSPMKRSLWITIGIIAVLGFVLYSSVKNSYNTIVVLNESVSKQLGQVENVYQRRADLIPNLVEVAKGYAQFEQSTLTEVAEARAKATSVTLTTDDLDNPQTLQKFNDNQNQLSQAFGRLLSVAESYPNLKADQNFSKLMTELEGTENRISVERKKFNESVQEYNTHIKQFPTNIFAGMFGFKEKAYFQAATGAQEAPKVKF
jgi:LemA protein